VANRADQGDPADPAKPSYEHEPTDKRAGSFQEGHLPVSELVSERAGPLSPFGEDTEFPLPADKVAYVHPTDRDRPNQLRDPYDWTR
jgi:hypothetical protein